MNRLLIATLLMIVLTGLSFGADQKGPMKVSIDELTRETQKTAQVSDVQVVGDSKGMNFIWVVPHEFWESALLQNPNVPKKQAEAMLEQMNGLILVTVVRAQIKAGGQFDFYDNAVVEKNLVAEFTDKAGKHYPLEITQDLDPGTGAILGAMKPILTAAMGKMGQNMHFFVYKDVGADGKRLVSPVEPGILTLTLKPLPGEPGGKVEMQFPLNSLFFPRECEKCRHTGMDIRWMFCPYCGEKLKL